MAFGQGLSGIDALKASMQTRGMDTSILDQMSASAPGVQVSPGNVPQSGQRVGFDERQLAGQTMEQPKQQPRSAEMEIALKALADTVKTENKIASSVMNPPFNNAQ